MSNYERFSPFISPKVSDLAVSRFSFEKSKTYSPHSRTSPISNTHRDLEAEHSKALEKIETLQVEKQQLKQTMRVLLDRRSGIPSSTEESVMNSKYVKEAFSTRRLIKELEEKNQVIEQEKIQLQADLERERSKYLLLLKEQQQYQNKLVDFEKISSSNDHLKVEMMKLNAELYDINQKVAGLEMENKGLIRIIHPEGASSTDSADYLQYIFKLLDGLPSNHYAKVSFQERFSSLVVALSELQEKKYSTLLLKTLEFATDLLVNVATERNFRPSVRENLNMSFEGSQIKNAKDISRKNNGIDAKVSQIDPRSQLMAANDELGLRDTYKSSLKNQSIDLTTSYIHTSTLPTERDSPVQFLQRSTELARQRPSDHMRQASNQISLGGNSQLRLRNTSSAFKPMETLPSTTKHNQSQSMFDDATTATPNLNDSTSTSRLKTPSHTRHIESENMQGSNAHIKIQNEVSNSRGQSRSFQTPGIDRAHYQMRDEMLYNQDLGDIDNKIDHTRIRYSLISANDGFLQEDALQSAQFYQPAKEINSTERLERSQNSNRNAYPPQNYEDQRTLRPSNQQSNRKNELSRAFEGQEAFDQSEDNFVENHWSNPNVNYPTIPLSTRTSQQPSTSNRPSQAQTYRQTQKTPASNRASTNNLIMTANSLPNPEYINYPSSEPVIKEIESVRVTPQQSLANQNFGVNNQMKSKGQFQYHTHRPQDLNIPTEESDLNDVYQQDAQLPMNRATLPSQGSLNYSKSGSLDNETNPHSRQLLDFNQAHSNQVYTNQDNAGSASFRGESENRNHQEQMNQRVQEQQQHNYYPERQMNNSNPKQQVVYSTRSSQNKKPEINLQDSHQQQFMPNNTFNEDKEQHEFFYSNEIDQPVYVQTRPQNLRHSEHNMRRQQQFSDADDYVSNRPQSYSQQNAPIESPEQQNYSNSRPSRNNKVFEQNDPRSSLIVEQASLKQGQQPSELLEDQNTTVKRGNSRVAFQPQSQQIQQLPKQQQHQSIRQSQLQEVESQEQVQYQQHFQTPLQQQGIDTSENRVSIQENRSIRQPISQKQQKSDQNSPALKDSLEIDSATNKTQGTIPRHDPNLEAARYENKMKRANVGQSSDRKAVPEIQEGTHNLNQDEDLCGFESTRSKQRDSPDRTQLQEGDRKNEVRDPNLTIRATRSVSFEEEEKSPLDKKLIASTSNLKPNRSQSDFLNTTNNSFRTLKISQTESNRKSQFGRKSQLDAYEDMSPSPSLPEKSFRVSFGKTMSHDIGKKSDRFEIVPVERVCIDESTKKGRVSHGGRNFDIINGLPKEPISRANSSPNRQSDLNKSTELRSSEFRGDSPMHPSQ